MAFRAISGAVATSATLKRPIDAAQSRLVSPFLA